VAGSNTGGLAFREVGGLVQFTPASASDNGGVTLRVPYYLVPRSLSQIISASDNRPVKAPKVPGNFNVRLQNRGAVAGDADFYAWGLEDKKDKTVGSSDIRAVGVQSFPSDGVMAFAVNTHERWSNAAANEFDLPVDVNNDGAADYIVVGADQGAVQTGTANGRVGVFVFSARSGGASIAFLANDPTDSSTLVLPVLISQLCRAGEPCLNAANPRFSYGAVSFDGNGNADEVDGTAKFNPFTSAISTGAFQTLAPGAFASQQITVDQAEWAQTPTKGVMVVSVDDKSGQEEADLLEILKK
jgi:hypothetical protein